MDNNIQVESRPHNVTSNHEIDISQILVILRQYKNWLFAVWLPILVLGYLYANLSTPIYRSDALLRIEDKKNPLSLLDDLPFSSGVSGSVRSEVDIITSRRVLGAVVDVLKLQIVVRPNYTIADKAMALFSPSAAHWSWQPGGIKQGEQELRIRSIQLPARQHSADLILQIVEDGGFVLSNREGTTILAGRPASYVENSGYGIYVEPYTYPVGTRLNVNVLSPTDAIEVLKSRLRVSTDTRKSDGVIRLSYEYFDAEASMVILNEIVKHYVQYDIANNTEITEKTLSFIEGQLQKFSKDVAFNNELYLMLLTKAHELRVMKAGQIGSVRIVDQAVVPSLPVAPRRGLIIGLAGIVGLFAGIMAAFGRRMMDHALYDPNLIESNLNIPVYATIPLSQVQIKLNKQGWKISNNGNVSYGLLYREEPDDPAIEALRFLRTMIDKGELRNRHGAIAITGTSPNVGKTFISTNLACILSEVGLKVLLIDADLRRGVVHEYFALEKECGLAEYLTETVTIDSIIKYSGSGQMDIITRGGSPDNPSVLMSSSRLRSLLDACRKDYDVILIDTPPALAVTDATIISRQVDQVLMVVKAGLTTMDEVSVCWRRLTQSGKCPSGLVLSGYDSSKLGYGKYHQYGYY